MGDKCFIDSNILVYAYDASEKVKHNKAFKLLEHLGVLKPEFSVFKL